MHVLALGKTCTRTNVFTVRYPVATPDQHPFGRVDDDGTVYVTEDGVERRVGQYPDGTPEEALAYFTRKFSDLEGQVALLEQRVKRGAPAADVKKSADSLAKQIESANAVGDFAQLKARLADLGGTVSELSREQEASSKAEMDEAIAHRESIVVEAEKLAAQPPKQIQWKQTSAAMEELFKKWQNHQQNGPRLPKGEANALWKRFREARSTLDSERRAFFAELDAQHKTARDQKERIIARAEALAPRGADGVPEYRRLLDEWKAAGRAGRKHDDALWARFKAAGDVLFAAKNEIDAAELAESTENLEKKQALLDEAEPITKMTDRVKAREALTGIQRRWDEIGRVPKQHFRAVEDRLRAIEQHVRKLDDDHWQASNPEKKARSEGMQSQLEEAIAKLERERAEAEAAGDQKAVKAAEEALAARRSWLDAIGG